MSLHKSYRNLAFEAPDTYTIEEHKIAREVVFCSQVAGQNISCSNQPSTYDEAINGPDGEEWLKAVENLHESHA